MIAMVQKTPRCAVIVLLWQLSLASVHAAPEIDAVHSVPYYDTVRASHENAGGLPIFVGTTQRFIFALSPERGESPVARGASPRSGSVYHPHSPGRGDRGVAFPLRLSFLPGLLAKCRTSILGLAPWAIHYRSCRGMTPQWMSASNEDGGAESTDSSQTGGSRGSDSPIDRVAADADLRRVKKAEQARIDMIERVAPSVVCIFDEARRGGGSGVLIDREGYGLTNFHVVAGMLGTRHGSGGLSDGRLYDLEVLGIDPTGDVAMFRLLGRDDFPHAIIGDSDAVRIGDTAIAMGNPFVLSEDYTPTVTMGIVTGVHRYQEGSDNQLVYSDCIQIDTSINPGNSGGPLFNGRGELIGINGRISVNTRGRFNVGFGYAISTAQISRFMPGLRAGLLTPHGTLQATVDDLEGLGVIFDEILHDAPAYNVGVRVGDELLAFDGVPIRSSNHFASLLGTYPANWPVTLTVGRSGSRRRTVTRLEVLPPRMPAPFELLRSVNEREIERVLDAHRSATLGGGNAPPIKRFSWTVRRENHISGADGHTAAVHFGGNARVFEASRAGDGPVRMSERVAGAAPGMRIEFDEIRAVERHGASNDAFEPTTGQAMVYRAQYVAMFHLLVRSDLLDLAGTTHFGGDVRLVLGDTPARDRRTPLEIVEWKLPGPIEMKLGFDISTHRIDRIIVRDVPTNAMARIILGGFGETNGVTRPGTIEVAYWKDGAFAPAYRETLTGWEVER